MNENQTPSDQESKEPSTSDVRIFTKPRSKFPGVGDIFAMFGIFIAAELIATLATIIFGLTTTTGTATTTPEILGMKLSFSSLLSYVLALGGILLYRSARGGAGSIARLSPRGLNPMLILWGFLLLTAVGVVLEPLLRLLPSLPTEALGRGAWTMMAMVFFAPVFEELICRGVVLESLRAKYGVWIAWFVSALFFGAIHLQPQLVVNAFFIGLIFAFLYIRTNSLWIVIILHAINNAIAYIAMMMGHSDFMLSNFITHRPLYLLIYWVAAAVCVVSSVMIFRVLKQLDAQEKNQPAA
ncbi:MAG: type II CAAX endopeptidase family protein [Alistipes sp.]